MYGSLQSVGSILVLIGLITLGLFLGRFHLKYVMLSIAGLFVTTLYLYFSFSVNFVNWSATAYLIPIVLIIFFFSSLFVLVRLGIYIRTKQLLSPNNDRISVFTPEFTIPGGRIRRFTKWFTFKENMIVCAIVLITFTIHMIYINNPAYGIGDENAYVNEAKRIISGQPLLWLEHPPLAKWFIAGGISIFGDNAVGWRIFSILFGTASIFIFYLICVELVKTSVSSLGGQNENTANLFRPGIFIPVFATFLFSFENLSFVLAHMAMLDVFYVTLMLLGFLFYLKHRYVLCGVTMGLSLLCKETALFGIIAIILHWIIIHRSEIAEDIRYTWRSLRGKDVLQFRTSEALDFARIPVIITGIWVLLLPLLEWAKTPLWGMLFTRTWYLVWKNLMYSGMGQGNGAIAPIHTWAVFFQQHLQNFNFVSGVPRYIDAVSFSIWALLIPVIIYLVYQTFQDLRHGQKHSIAAFALCWFLPVYGLFIIIDIMIKRPMYDFYIYAAIPAVCLAIALGSWKIWDMIQGHKKLTIVFYSILVLFILATLVSFIIMSPLGSNFLNLPLTI